MAKPMVTLSVRLTPEQHEALAIVCKRDGYSMTGAIGRAVDKFVALPAPTECENCGEQWRMGTMRLLDKNGIEEVPAKWCKCGPRRIRG